VVTAEAVDDGSIQTVSLSWSVDSGAPVTVVMASTVPTLYRGEVAGQVAGSLVRYFVEVTDNEGNVQRSKEFSFSVGGADDGDGGDNPPPCGNFAVTLPGPGSSSGPMATLLVQVSLLGLAWIALRRRVRG
jgi:hypothetical protein